MVVASIFLSSPSIIDCADDAWEPDARRRDDERAVLVRRL